jgi:hypothetical protein
MYSIGERIRLETLSVGDVFFCINGKVPWRLIRKTGSCWRCEDTRNGTKKNLYYMYDGNWANKAVSEFENQGVNAMENLYKITEGEGTGKFVLFLSLDKDQKMVV